MDASRLIEIFKKCWALYPLESNEAADFRLGITLSAFENITKAINGAMNDGYRRLFAEIVTEILNPPKTNHGIMKAAPEVRIAAVNLLTEIISRQGNDEQTRLFWNNLFVANKLTFFDVMEKEFVAKFFDIYDKKYLEN